VDQSSPNFRRRTWEGLYPRYHACLPTRQVEKFCEGTPPGHNDVTANAQNVKPIFECSLLQNVGGTPVPGGLCASKPWSICSACKKMSWQRPLGAKIWSSEKGDLGGSKLTSPTLLLVDQSSLDLFHRTGEGLLTIH